MRRSIKETDEKEDKFVAYCRGFLVTKDDSLEMATMFCKGFLYELKANENTDPA